jgi:hypothetical protein
VQAGSTRFHVGANALPRARFRERRYPGDHELGSDRQDEPEPHQDGPAANETCGAHERDGILLEPLCSATASRAEAALLAPVF